MVSASQTRMNDRDAAWLVATIKLIAKDDV